MAAATMRIMHLLPTLQRRGAQVFTAEFCRALGRRDVSQHLAVLAPGPDEVDIGTALGTEAISFLPRGIAGVVGLRRLSRALRPQIVVAHGGEPLRSAVVAGAARGGPVLVYRKITLTKPLLRAPRWLRVRCHRLLAGRADAVVAVGAAVAAEVVEMLRVPAPKVRVIYRGVPFPAASLLRTSRERVRTALGVPVEAAMLLTVGALSWEKNQTVLLRAFAAVRDRIPDAVLVFAGEGPERVRLERMANELGLSAAVRFLGLRRDIPELLGAADVFVLASLAEGLPGVLVEAGLAGVPAVAWDVAAVREVVRDGITGLVPPFGDELALAAAMQRVLADPDGGRRMGAAALEFCRERFSMERCIDEHLELFSALLGAHS